MIALADPPQAGSVKADQPAGRSIKELSATVSASRLGTWLQCRLKFAFRYVFGIKKPPTPPLHVGTVIHAVLQQWNLARWRQSPLDESALHDVFIKSWAVTRDDGKIEWDGEEEIEKTTAWNTVQVYLRDTPIPLDEKPEGVEVGVEANLTGHGLPMLVGVLDLVRAGGRIVDFKTIGRTPDPRQSAHLHEIQATIYGLLYREATGTKENGIELHNLVKLKTPKLVITELGTVTEHHRTRLLRIIESYLIGLAREDFVPSPGLACMSCEFFRECRAWR